MGEIDDILEAAMLKEVASQTFYIAEGRTSQDPGVVTLMKDLATEEAKHLEWLKRIKDKGINSAGLYPEKGVTDLKLSSYLSGGDTLEGAGLQEALIFAIKREQQSMEFYNNMMDTMRDKAAKLVCRRLAQAELGHKYKLEKMYDDLFYQQD